jgi:outer membrane lipoprotein SlyB
MESTNTIRRIHPLVAGAAISVMLASLTGVAAITGLIPNSHGTAGSAEQTIATEAATSPSDRTEEKTAAAPQPPPAPAVQKQQKPVTRTTQSRPAATQATTVAQAPAACRDCGRVESVQTIQQAAQASGVGAVAGAVLGGVLGNQVGGGNGRKLATVAGAIGGGYAGNEVEKRTRATTTYEVRVRLETGAVRTFPYTQQPGWNVGDRVRVVEGRLTART